LAQDCKDIGFKTNEGLILYQEAELLMKEMKKTILETKSLDFAMVFIWIAIEFHECMLVTDFNSFKKGRTSKTTDGFEFHPIHQTNDLEKAWLQLKQKQEHLKQMV